MSANKFRQILCYFFKSTKTKTMKIKYVTLTIIQFFFSSILINSQVQLNGNAIALDSNCYQLTSDNLVQSGSIWDNNLFDLNTSFDMQFNIFLGCKPYTAGADGIVFVLQPLSVNAGTAGGGIGFAGITPSIGVEFDTYENAWDPTYCHVVIEKNGNVDHTNLTDLLAGPAPLSPSGTILPDCTDHLFRITWDPILKTMNIYFDCSLRLSYTGDIINDVFLGNSNVYWGFTSATGGASNTHEVCFINSPLNVLQDSTICLGESIQLEATGGESYSWSPSIGLNATNIPNPVASPTSTTTYIVTKTDLCGNQSVDSIEIIVIDTLVTVNDLVICQGESDLLIASGADSYIWSTGELTNQLMVSPLITTSYTVIGLTNGCSGSAIGTVTVNPTPIINVNSVEICYGESATLTATGADFFVWNTGLNSNSLNASPLSTTVYTVSGTIGECSSSTSATITVFPPLLADAGLNDTICIGDSIALTAYPNEPLYSYSWIPNVSLIGSDTYHPISFPISSTTYELIITDTNGCIGMDSVTIGVLENPIVSFTSDIHSGCSPLCVTFTDASIISNDIIINWFWDFDDIINSSNTASPSYCFDTPGHYSINLSVITSNGCVASYLADDLITVFEDPIANFSITSPDSEFSIYSEIEFTDESYGANEWFWYLDESTTSIMQNPTYNYSDTGTYCVLLKIKNSDGCSDTILKCFGIHPFFSLYVPNTFTPNDDDSNDTFYCVGEYIDTFSMKIYNRWGEVVFSSEDIHEHWNGKYQNQLVESGVYTYKIEIIDKNNKHRLINGHVTVLR